MSARELITEHLDLWTGAATKKSSSGRGSNGKVELTGVKKLRELILELAVRGRLVEQDPREEPAHLILEWLDSNVKKSKGKQRTSRGASQPSLPTGWACFRVGDYLDFQYGKSLPAKQRDDSGSIEVYGSNGVVGFHAKALTEEPCIVVGRKGSAGALNKALGPSWTTDVAYYVQPPQGFDFEFTYLLLRSLHLDRLGKGIKPGVNRNEAYSLTALLPPLEEQHRIVQKVDELMALCDRLEQQTSDQLEAHETLVDTLLGTLTQSENATELADNWARLAAHFDTLFTTEQSIDKLKQTILQLAVMGRLVEQDEHEESADRLLTSLSASPVKVDESLFPIPSNWRWTRLGSISRINGGFAFKSSNYQETGVRVVRISDFDEYGFKNEAIVRHEYTEKLSGFQLAENDILMAMTGGTVGKSYLVEELPEPMVVNQRVATIKIPAPIDAKYIYFLLKTKSVRDVIENAKNSTNDNISMKDIQNFLVPLPIAQEQHRIVQKVDELMALCDQLKDRLTQAGETRCQLAESVVEGALKV